MTTFRYTSVPSTDFNSILEEGSVQEKDGAIRSGDDTGSSDFRTDIPLIGQGRGMGACSGTSEDAGDAVG